MSDPKKKPEKAPNQWLAQQASLARFHKSMQAAGMRISKRPSPLQPGSVVITIPFPSALSQPPSIEPTVPDNSNIQPREANVGEGAALPNSVDGNTINSVVDEEEGSGFITPQRAGHIREDATGSHQRSEVVGAGRPEKRNHCGSEGKATSARVPKTTEQNITAETDSAAWLAAFGSTGSLLNAESSRLLGEIAVRVVRLGAGYSKDVIARIREITGFTKEDITDAQLKPFAVAALKYMGAFKSRPKATVQPVQPIAPLATSSAVEPPNALLRVWRDYSEPAFLLLVGQSCVLFSAATVLKNYFTDSFGNHIDWIDAAALLPILPGFLLLGVWTLITMNNRPKSMSIGKAALVMRFYLFVVGSLSWWLIDSPVLGWSAWAVIAGAFAATYAKLNKWN